MSVKRYVLPVWWRDDLRDVPAGDPIGCPVSIEEMINYLAMMPSFKVTSRSLEFITRGRIEKSSFWLWAFYGNDGRRWNLCVFSGSSWFGGPEGRTWMCADNNSDDLDDGDYIRAIYNREY